MPRYKVHWPVKLTGRNDTGVRYFGEGVLENISARGAYLYADKTAQVGEKLDVSIRLPLKQESWLIYSAEVVRVDCARGRPAMALEFDSSIPAFTDK